MGKLLKILSEAKLTRPLNETGFTIELLWPDEEGFVKDPGAKFEVVLVDFWVDSTMTSLFMQASPSAVERSVETGDKRLKALVGVLKKAIEQVLQPLETIDLTKTAAPSKKSGLPLFSEDEMAYRFDLEDKVRKDTVRQIASAVANKFQAYLPGLHASGVIRDED